MARCVVPPASSWMPWPLLGLTPEIACYSHGPDTQVGCCLPPPSPPLPPALFSDSPSPIPLGRRALQTSRQTDRRVPGGGGRAGWRGCGGGRGSACPLVQQQPSDYRSWGSSTTMLCGESTRIYLLLNSRCLSVYPAVVFICRTTRRSRRW